MSTFSINDIQEEDDAIDNALAKLGNFINDVLDSSHELVLANESFTIPTDPYITLRMLTSSGTIVSNMGNNAIYYDIDTEGNETYVFQDQLRVQIKAYKTNAFKTMKKLRKYLKNKEKCYTYFGSDPTVGITNIGQVVDSPTLMDDQKMEAGAIMTLSLNYVHIMTEDSGGIIEQVNAGLTVYDANEHIAYEGDLSVRYP